MNLAVIGGGPAGLRAAEVAATGGASVTLFDAKSSVGRKFLVAGKGGLNLTKIESADRFATRYSGPEQPDGLWESLIAGFNSDALREWASGLGVETFVASTGRVYPRELKAAPLLRNWVRRLRALDVKFAMRHRWTGLTPGTPHQLHFQANNEPLNCEADAVILALGGGSWPETGSDGAWTTLLENLGVSIAPLAPANCGWELAWPPEVLVAAEGKPVKNCVVHAGEMSVAGELMVTSYGLEGSAIYQLGTALRAMQEPALTLDFKPTFTREQLVAKMSSARANFLDEARTRWRLCDAACSILKNRGPFPNAESLAAEVKACVLRLTRPRPLAEAISSAGGVRWNELDDGLMLHQLPGVFVAGEMIDWEAPTGGYLIQGCLATGTRAAQSALQQRRRDFQVP
ncbi:MAG: TIGR03862 family flavoprotein [Verrucomicrobiota bacterium]